jgi:cardiolipin synthase
MEWLARIETAWHLVFQTLVLALDLCTSAHAILFKRDHRAAVMWVAFIWFSPLVGAVCYLLLGVNRIRRRASRLRSEESRPAGLAPAATAPVDSTGFTPTLQGLTRLATNVTGRPLLAGNAFQPLENCLLYTSPSPRDH